jgi:hypothetical protein
MPLRTLPGILLVTLSPLIPAHPRIVSNLFEQRINPSPMR